jgi:hypothetical protein
MCEKQVINDLTTGSSPSDPIDARSGKTGQGYRESSSKTKQPDFIVSGYSVKIIIGIGGQIIWV